MDKKRKWTASLTAASLVITLVSGCATTEDRTRHEGARSGALRAVGYTIHVGGELAREDAGSGVLFMLVTAPIAALVGAAVGAATTRK